MDIFQIFGEIGTADPWTVRGWFFLFSREYREERIQKWRASNAFYVVADITLSLAAMLVELAIVFVAGAWVFLHFTRGGGA